MTDLAVINNYLLIVKLAKLLNTLLCLSFIREYLDIGCSLTTDSVKDRTEGP